MVGPPCCRPAGELLAYLNAAERNILPHHRLGEAASSPGSPAVSDPRLILDEFPDLVGDRQIAPGPD